MSMMRVRPVGMSMMFFQVLVFVNMHILNVSYVFVNMMHIVVIVQMRMGRLSMQVGVQMLFRAYKPDAGAREHHGRKHDPTDPLLKQHEGSYRADERGEAPR